jgi:CheY-like chemotaxis protein
MKSSPSRPAISGPARREIPDTKLRDIKVVAVDDNADSRELLIVLLERSGAKAVVVSSGREALEAIRDLHPDVLLCDLAMPDMDGFGVLENVRGDNQSLDDCRWLLLQLQLVTRIALRPDWPVSKHIWQNRLKPKHWSGQSWKFLLLLVKYFYL